MNLCVVGACLLLVVQLTLGRSLQGANHGENLKELRSFLEARRMKGGGGGGGKGEGHRGGHGGSGDRSGKGSHQGGGDRMGDGRGSHVGGSMESEWEEGDQEEFWAFLLEICGPPPEGTEPQPEARQEDEELAALCEEVAKHLEEGRGPAEEEGRRSLMARQEASVSSESGEGDSSSQMEGKRTFLKARQEASVSSESGEGDSSSQMEGKRLQTLRTLLELRHKGGGGGGRGRGSHGKGHGGRSRGSGRHGSGSRGRGSHEREDPFGYLTDMCGSGEEEDPMKRDAAVDELTSIMDETEISNRLEALYSDIIEALNENLDPATVRDEWTASICSFLPDLLELAFELWEEAEAEEREGRCNFWRSRGSHQQSGTPPTADEVSECVTKRLEALKLLLEEVDLIASDPDLDYETDPEPLFEIVHLLHLVGREMHAVFKTLDAFTEDKRDAAAELNNLVRAFLAHAKK